MWYAKPRGGYGYRETEGRENVLEIGTYLGGKGYTLEVQAGICGNVVAESGLNPWRWQGDTYGLGRGYGLFQFTPARDYINQASAVAYYAPNLSTTTQTAGAEPTDALAQLEVFDTNLLRKWISSCWRSYWDKETYEDEWAIAQDILNIYGNGTSITMGQFKLIDNVEYATFAFLACFEGPATPSGYNGRVLNAKACYDILQGGSPTPEKQQGMPIWMMLRPFL